MIPTLHPDTLPFLQELTMNNNRPWFNDHKDGIEEQIRVYARTAPLGSYVGMLTDSRSFLSYPRHEYFRRILCNYVGGLVEAGEFPWNEEGLGNLIKRICYENSIEFFKR